MSTLKVNTIQNASGGSSSTAEQINQGRAKVWINFNGTGTIAIRDSFNVSSITDNGGNGDYTVNYSTAMANDDYVIQVMARRVSGTSEVTTTFFSISTDSARVMSLRVDSGANLNSDTVCVVVFGDQ